MVRDRADDDQAGAMDEEAASSRESAAPNGDADSPALSVDASIEGLCRDLASTLLPRAGAALDAPAEEVASPDAAFARVLELATRYVPGASAAAVMTRTAAGTFVYAASRGFELAPDGAEGAFPRPTEGGEARVRHLRHRVPSDEAAASSAEVPAPLALRGSVHETLSLPVHVGGELQAFLELYALADQGGFGERPQALGLLLAAQLGAVLQRLALEEALEVAASRLEHASHHDALTGLPNRALLVDRLASALARDRRAGRVTVLFSIDLGALERVEEERGLAAVESLWIHSATGLRRALREADTVARCGSEGLAVVAGGVRDSESAYTIAITLQFELHRALEGVLPGLDRQAMIGVSVAPLDGTTAGALMLAAEAARDEARRRGPGSVAFHADAIDASARSRDQAAAMLAEALDRRDVRVRYEPVLRLSDRRWVALRLVFDHPQLALESHRSDATASYSSVHAVIGLADDARREEELFAALVEQACSDLETWRALEPSRPWRVLIPISSRLLRDGRAERIALSASRRLGLPAGAIAWSVAAGRLGGVSPALLRGLASARRAGFDLIVDDVDGEGPPLRSLAELPLGGLTLASTTVRNLGSDQRDDAMAAAVAALTRVVGIPLGAVDVDSVGTAERLEALGCVQACGPSLAAIRTAEAVCEPEWAGLEANGSTGQTRS